MSENTLFKTFTDAILHRVKSFRGDWNQNDPSADNYIANRPFYVAGTSKEIILEEQIISLQPYYGGMYVAQLPPTLFELVLDTEYVIEWDGTSYTFTSMDMEGAVVLGDFVGANNGTFVEAPFVMMYIPGQVVMIVGDSEGDHNVAISTIAVDIRTIDEKFLPDTVITTDTAIGASGSGMHGEIFNNYGSLMDPEPNVASGAYSHAEGRYTTASATSSHAEGENAKATYMYAHAEGVNTTASGRASHAEGDGTTASGNESHAEGSDTTANSDYSHAEGRHTVASAIAAHAEGYNTTASSRYAHAEGYNTTASGDYSHAEGESTTASDGSAHAEGYNTTASESYSHAEGTQTKASNYAAHAEGIGTIAASRYQHVQGQYNVEDTANTYAHIVGGGTSTVRKNIHTVDWNGNGWYLGDLRVGGTSYSDAKIVATKVDWNESDTNSTAYIENRIAYDYYRDYGINVNQPELSVYASNEELVYANTSIIQDERTLSNIEFAYSYTINGATYIRKSVSCTDDSGVITEFLYVDGYPISRYVGNLALLGLGEDTHEPFLDCWVVKGSGVKYFFVDTTSTTMPVSMKVLRRDFKQLSETLIPSTIARISDVEAMIQAQLGVIENGTY